MPPPTAFWAPLQLPQFRSTRCSSRSLGAPHAASSVAALSAAALAARIASSAGIGTGSRGGSRRCRAGLLAQLVRLERGELDPDAAADGDPVELAARRGAGRSSSRRRRGGGRLLLAEVGGAHRPRDRRRGARQNLFSATLACARTGLPDAPGRAFVRTAVRTGRISAGSGRRGARLGSAAWKSASGLVQPKRARPALAQDARSVRDPRQRR